MRKYLLLFLALGTLNACVSPEEQRAAAYRYEELITSQCQQTLGLPMGTQNYMNCRIFYDEYMDALGYSTDYMSFSKVQNMQRQVDALNSQCGRYIGQGSSRQYLWSCVQTLGQKRIEQARHEKELQEQEEMFTRSMRQANEEARIQEKIDEERERVARETGKNPKKIYCTTSTKSNGYIKVKCK